MEKFIINGTEVYAKTYDEAFNKYTTVISQGY